MPNWDRAAVEFRRDLHRIPELAFEERKTQAYLEARLSGWGIDCCRMAGTGLVADIRGDLGDGPIVAVRADMDALPMTEETGFDFASEHPGKMHACGHDGHMAMVLAAAGELNEKRDFRGTVRVLFQPSEEKGGGALKMIAEGCLDGVSEIFAVHLWSMQETGTVQLGEGPQMASAEGFQIVIHGRGGHGSEPESTRDAVLIAAQTVVNLQTVVARKVPAREPVVVSCGTLHAGDTFNVIAERAEITGEVRTYDPGIQQRVAAEIRRIAETTAAMSEAVAEVRYMPGCPALFNHGESVRKWLAALDPDVRVIPPVPKLSAEDFADYLQRVPGAFMFVGAAPDNGEAFPQHSSHMTINERALGIGEKAILSACKAALQ